MQATKNQIDVERLHRLIFQLEEERRQPIAARKTRATDSQLDSAIRDVQSATSALEQQGNRPFAPKLSALATDVSASWSMDSSISHEILSCAEAAREVDDYFAPIQPASADHSSSHSPVTKPGLTKAQYLFLIILCVFVVIGIVTTIRKGVDVAVVRRSVIPIIVVGILTPIYAVIVKKRNSKNKK